MLSIYQKHPRQSKKANVSITSGPEEPYILVVTHTTSSCEMLSVTTYGSS